MPTAIEHQHQAAPLWRPKASCQRNSGAARDLDQPVGGLAENGEDHDRGQDLRGLAELLAVDQEIAEPFGGAHEFGGDHEHPAQPKADPQRDHIGRQHRGQQDAPDHRRPGEAEGAADLDDLAIDRQDRAHHAEIDREKHPDRDQRDFRGFENAEPQDEQRHPGDRRDRAQRLHGRIEQPARQSPIAGDRRRAMVPATTPRAKAQRRRGVSVAMMWRVSSPLRASSTMVAKILARRRHQPSVGQAEPDDDLPGQREADRQQQAKRRPRTAPQPRPDGARGSRSLSACSSAGSSTVMAIARRVSRGIARRLDAPRYVLLAKARTHNHRCLLLCATVALPAQS